MSLLGLVKGKGASGFGFNSTADAVTEGLDLTGQRILVTGSSSGIGLESVRTLARRGATVIVSARTLPKAQAVAAELGAGAEALACELGEPASVRAAVAGLVEQGAPLHAIIANAGIMALPDNEQLFGVEKQLFTNHVGHFMLVTGILDLLAPGGRVVALSSAAHKGAPSVGIEFENLSGERGYKAWRAYGQSKLANLLFARALAKRFEAEGQGRIAHGIHPGVIATHLTRHMNPVLQAAWALSAPLVLKSPQQGAATQVWAAVHPDAAKINGEYLSDCNVAASSDRGADLELAERLWTATEEIVARLP